MHHDILPAVKVRSSGIERAGRSCAFVGKDTAEIIGIGIDGYAEGTNRDKAIQRISVSQEAPLLG
jgi:hypothetical protein